MSFSPNEHTSELREIFFESAAEILQGMNEAALALEKRPNDTEQLRHVRRAVHTLKGDSSACGFRELSELAHSLEDVLAPELTRENEEVIAGIVLTAADTFQEMLSAYRSDGHPSPATGLQEDIKRLLRKSAVQRQHPVAPEPQVEWTEYEHLMIAETLRTGETVYKILLFVSAEAPLPAAAFELARKALDGAAKYWLCTRRKLRAWNGTRGSVPRWRPPHPEDWIRKRCQVPSIIDKIELELLSVEKGASRDLLEILLEAEAAATAASVKAGPVNPPATWEQPFHEANIAVSSPHAVPENSLRVDAARIDTVMNLIGELIISKSMLQRTIIEFERQHMRDPLRAKFSRRALVSIARPRRIAALGNENSHGSGRAALPAVPAHRARRGQGPQ